MIAKIKMGRDKDFIDWKAFTPYLKSQDSFNFNYEGFRHINWSEDNQNNALESNEASIPMFSRKPENNLNYLQQVEFRNSLQVGEKANFTYWSETTSQEVTEKDVIVTNISTDRFTGNYDNGEERIFKLSNVINADVPKEPTYEDHIKAKIDKIRESLLKQEVAFSKVKTEEGLSRLNAIKKALSQLDNYNGLDSLVDFLKTLKTSIFKSQALLLKLAQDEDNSEENVNKKLYTIAFVKRYIDSFEGIKGLSKLIRNSPASEELKREAIYLNNELLETQGEYLETVAPLLAKSLFTNFRDSVNTSLAKINGKLWTEERLLAELLNPSTDLDFLNTYGITLSNANDVIGGLLAAKVKNAGVKANFTLAGVVYKVKDIFKKFADNTELFSKMTYLKDVTIDGETKKVRAIIQQWDYKKFYDELKTKRKLVSELYILKQAEFAKPKEERSKDLPSIVSAYNDAKEDRDNYVNSYGEKLTRDKMVAKMEYLRKNDPEKFSKYLTERSNYFTPSSEEVADYSYTDKEDNTWYFTYNNNYLKPQKGNTYFQTDSYNNLMESLTPEEQEFYTTFKNLYEEFNNKLPTWRRFQEGILPAMFEESLTKDWQGGIVKKLNNMMEDNTSQYTSTHIDGTPFKLIPVGFMRPLDVSEASTDIITSLVTWMGEVENYHEKNKIYGTIDAIEKVLGESKPTDETQKKVVTKKVTNNRLDAISQYLKQVYYGETKASNTALDKFVDALGKFTALTKMALQPFGALANAIVGNYQNLAEGFGGRNFNEKNLKKGYSEFFKLLSNNKEKLDNILFSLDAVQGSFKNNLREMFSKNRLTVGDAFALYSYGEYELQGVACLALLDAYGIQIPENGLFKLEDLPKDFIPTLHELNKSNQGTYAEPLYHSDSAYFRLLLMFRKYVIPTYRSRWSGMFQGWSEDTKGEQYRIDLESGKIESGYYRSFAGYLVENAKALYKGKTDLLNWNNWSDVEREGIKRSIFEAVSMATAIIAIAMITPDEDDEEDGAIERFIEWETVYQLGRLRGDIAAYLPIIGTSDQLRMVDKPFAAASTVEQMYKLLTKVITLEQYEKDYQDFEEGDFKFRQPLSKLNPFDNFYSDPEQRYENFQAAGR